MVSLKSGSDEPLPSKVTVNGLLPEVGLAFRFATGGVFGIAAQATLPATV